MNKKPALSLSKAFLLIFLSVCLISGTFGLSLCFYKHLKRLKYADPAYTIVALVQTSADADGLKTAYLAELLDLSIDRPVNLYSFNSKEAESKLLKTSVLKTVKVRKILPGTIHVEYAKRKPVAYYGDYANTAVDAEGVIFPFKPFFTLKNLPEVITGYDLLSEPGICKECIWGQKIKNRWLDLAFDFLSLQPLFLKNQTHLKCIDVSHAFAGTVGEREVVLMLEDRIVRVKDGRSILCVYPRHLRLSVDTYHQQLANYFSLQKHLKEMERRQSMEAKEEAEQSITTVIDLRILDLAFFQKIRGDSW